MPYKKISIMGPDQQPAAIMESNLTTSLPTESNIADISEVGIIDVINQEIGFWEDVTNDDDHNQQRTYM